MAFKPRIKINGRETSEEKIISEIDSLLNGTNRRPCPLPAAEVAKILEYHVKQSTNTLSEKRVDYYYSKIKII